MGASRDGGVAARAPAAAARRAVPVVEARLSLLARGAAAARGPCDVGLDGESCSWPRGRRHPGSRGAASRRVTFTTGR